MVGTILSILTNKQENSTMRRTIILAGSDIENLEWAKSQIRSDDYIVCADSGLHHAHAMQIKPDIVTGDFDSVDHDLLDEYRKIDDVQIIHDPDQYSTDLMKSLSHAPAGTEVEVFGAIGGRGDHDFSHYLFLMQMEKPDHITLRSHNEQRRVIKFPHKFKADINDKVGIFPLQPIENMHFKGLEYQADGLPKPYTLGWNGACNIVKEEEVEIIIDSGAALIIHSSDQKA